MFDQVQVGLGNFLHRFYDDLIPTTKQLKEYKRRGFPYCFVFAPSRMVDQAELMLQAWFNNDTSGKPTTPPKLPVVICAISKDYIPTGRDFSFQIADRMNVIIPEDKRERIFGVKTICADVRAQFAICAADVATAKSIAAQLSLFLDSPSHRSFDAIYNFAGIDIPYPCQIESPDSPASNIETGGKNVTMLAFDIILKCTIPLYDAPDEDEPNDGKGDEETPNGYPVVQEIHQMEKMMN